MPHDDQPTQPLGERGTPPPADIHDQPTQAMDDGARLAPPTLPGSDGLDPNPDFTPDRLKRLNRPIGTDPDPDETPSAFEAGHTVPHIIPFEHTVVHVPPQGAQPAAAPSRFARPDQPTIPSPPAWAQTTQPNPYTPYAAATMQANPTVLPPRVPGRRRLFGCAPGCLMVLVGLMVSFCGGTLLLTLILTATLGAELENRLQQQLASVDTYEGFQTTYFYDRDERLLTEAFTEGRRTKISYNDLPAHFIHATIAIEDDTFFINPGFEFEATARAFLQYVGLREGSSGGSTITQQVVRNILFDQEYRIERSITRKAEEIILAWLLSQRYSKEEVLELYLNEIFYGNFAYGAEAAAQTFFNKSIRDVTLGEAAMLAGLPQAPAELDPLNPDPTVQAAVNARWRLVLNRMVTEGYITPPSGTPPSAPG